MTINLIVKESRIVNV